MAKTKDENGDGGKTENVVEVPQDSNALIAQALKLIAENMPAKQVTEGSPEYQARLKAEGFYDYFSKPVYQNGREAEPRGLSEEVRSRTVALRPGKYIRGFVTVEPTSNGGVHIKYKSVTTDDRMKTAGLWADFSDLINKIWAEMHAAVPAE